MLLVSGIGRTMSGALALVLATTVVGCGGSRAELDPDVLARRPDLSGQWKFNAEDSDDTRAILSERVPDAQQEGRQPAGRASGGRRGGGGRPSGGSGGRPGGRQDAGMDPGAMRRNLEAALRAPPVLQLAQDDTTVTVVEGQGAPVSLHTDNRKTELSTATGSKIEFRAQWKNTDLVVEQKFAAAKVTMTYFLSQTTDQLFVVVKVEANRTPGAIEFRRVYDPTGEP